MKWNAYKYVSYRVLPAGFTLLEVMVAIAILALSLTAIFSTEVQNVSNANHSKWLVTANLLARCRMSEVELRLRKDGFPESDESESDVDCCEIFETDDYKCKWNIQRVELPSTVDVETAITEAMTKESLSNFVGEFQAERISNQLQSMGGMGVLSSLLPMINDLLVGTIRRVDVEVSWKERGIEKKTTLTEYFVNPGEGVSGALLKMGVMEDLMKGVTPQNPLDFNELQKVLQPKGVK